MMEDQPPAESSWRPKLNSRCVGFLLTLAYALSYGQDIFQDLLLISSSLQSKDEYSVLFNMKITERSFGHVMTSTFVLSVLIVGFDAAKKGSRLIIVKQYPWLQSLMLLACLVNLGPVFFLFLNFAMDKKCVKKLYHSNEDAQSDQKNIKGALSSVKVKEALCENLPMLIVVCFKTALSSTLSWLEVLSSTSSACLLSKVIIDYASDQQLEPLGLLKKLLGSWILGMFIYTTLMMITAFH